MCKKSTHIARMHCKQKFQIIFFTWKVISLHKSRKFVFEIFFLNIIKHGYLILEMLEQIF
jgi:hypothetical protein